MAPVIKLVIQRMEVIMQPTGVLETSKATKNPLKELLNYGQSMWLDYIRRDLFTTGKLKQMIDDDGLRGMTSNPAIFEKAIARQFAVRRHVEVAGLAQGPRHDRRVTNRSPSATFRMRPTHCARCTTSLISATDTSAWKCRPISRARRRKRLTKRAGLWKAVQARQRHDQGSGHGGGIFPRSSKLIGEGININVTLLFAQDVYEKVAEAYIAGLEELASHGRQSRRRWPASPASSSAASIRSSIPCSTDKLKDTSDATQQALLKSLLGKVAIANGKLTYKSYQQIFSGPRWQALAAKGAQTQRVLWASTSTKNPNYRDVIYVEELIGPDTVNTMPPATVDAFRDHGRLRNSLDRRCARAQPKSWRILPRAGISMKEVTDKLTDDGVKLFADAFDKLLAAVAKEHAAKRIDREPTEDFPARNSGCNGEELRSPTGNRAAR